MRRGPQPWGEGFPYDVPAVAALEELSLDAPITLLAGDNGSGKSTIVEAIAAAMGFAAEGGELERSGELPAVPRPVLGDTLSPVLSSTKPHSGYFLRAESFFNIASFVDGQSTFAPDLSLYGDVPLHAQSHGQSFLALAANRFGGESLYILDEPEAALSVSGALACPQARIYELDENGLAPCEYDDLDAVRFTRGFLAAPERYLRAALEDG